MPLPLLLASSLPLPLPARRSVVDLDVLTEQLVMTHGAGWVGTDGTGKKRA
jgi:hypothetical protein